MMLPARFRVHLWCASFERGTCVGYRGYVIDRQFDPIDNVLGFFLACGNDGR